MYIWFKVVMHRSSVFSCVCCGSARMDA